jgi:hypothetical protein
MAHTKVTKTHSQNTGAANTFSYSGSFDVFKATEVQVELDNIALTFTASTINESASPREYTVDTSAKTIHIGGADLSSGTIIIRPVTDMGAPTPRANYEPGASVTSADLNNNQLQLMRKAMEYDEQKLSSIGGTMTGHLTIGEDQTIIFEGATSNAYETTLTVTDPTADRTITLPNVTGTVVTTGDTATVTAHMLADNSVDSGELIDGSIDAQHISSGAITGAKIAADAVDGTKLADNAVDSEHYTDGSIDTVHIADSQVTTAKIADGAVSDAKIINSNVTTVKIADSAVTTAKINDTDVTTAKLRDTNVTTAKIANLNVTTAKIADDAITNAKIADDAIDSAQLGTGVIDEEHLSSSAVTNAKIASGAVDSSKIATGGVATGNLASGAVTTGILAADAVTGAKLADDAIESEHYTDGSIDTAHIADANVTTAKLADDAITTAKITDVNVTTAKIADNAITFAKIGCEQTTISNTDTSVPTSGAVVDYVAAQIAPIGGLEVIANKDAFPETQPAAGVVISIADAVGIVVNGSGTSTTPDTISSDATVTINNINSSFNSSTVASGIGWLVSSTGSGQIYNYHKANIKESDVIQLSDDVNDFNSRYRVNAGEPSSNNDEGDLVYDTNADKMKVYDSATSAWKEVTSTGDFKYLFLCPAGGTGAPTLDGSIATYDLRESSNSGSSASVTNAAQLLVSINGVVQKANTGTSAPAEGFALVDANTIIFGANLASGDSVFIVQFGSALTITTPGDGTVSTAKLAADAVTGAKIADNAIDSEHYVDGSIDHVHLANDAVDGDNLADDAVNSEHYVDGSIDTAHIADDQVTLAKMAGLARGKIIYGDSSGNPAALAIGTSGYTLISDGTDISWGEAAAGAAGGGSDKIFWENGQSVTTNYTITNNMNAGSFGPITINNGVTVTVGSGENWTIV